MARKLVEAMRLVQAWEYSAKLIDAVALKPHRRGPARAEFGYIELEKLTHC